jgi:hypothetical protein
LSTSSSRKTGFFVPCLLHSLEDAARHRADVGPPVAADVGLVARAAERDADVLAPHRPRDRLRDRSLSDSRRSGEEKDPAARAARDGLRALRRLTHDFDSGLSLDDVGFFGLVGLLRGLLRPFPILRELSHREELEDAVLDVLQPVMVFVEHARGLGNVELLVAARVPRQLRRRSRDTSG